ncbi:hypothetical protein ACHQM5_001664 [Ranunculus cassubicifolius]
MQNTTASLSLSSSSSPVLQFTPFSSPSKPYNTRVSLSKKRPARIYAARRDANEHCGNRVDEDLIVLRMRIHDIQMEADRREISANWMEWEKKYYSYYDSDIMQAVGWLQTQLLNTRPIVALGMAILLAFSVTSSTTMVLSFVFEMIFKSILSGTSALHFVLQLIFH